MALRVRLLRKSLKLNQEEFAELLGVTQPTISRWERGNDIPDSENLAKLAQLAGKSIDEFAGYVVSDDINIKNVGVVGAVQAGVWVDAVEWTLGDQFNVSWSKDGIWDHYPKFGLKVRGSSMNLIYPEGSIVICVRFYDLDGRDPRPGERVVVYRRKNDQIEATLKEFVLQDGRGWLWPRSSDPAFQAPIEMHPEGVPPADHPEVYALVIGRYSPETSRP